MTLYLRNLSNGPIYYISFYYKGKRYKISTGTRELKLARKIYAEIQKKVVLGVFNLNEYEEKNITLSEYYEIYFQNVKGTKKESTITGEKIYYNTFMRIVGDISLRSLDLVTLERWRSVRLSTVKPTTYNIERAALSSIFSKAVEYDYIKENLFRRIKEMKIEERRLYWTMDEEQKFFDKLEGYINTSRGRNHRETYRLFKAFVIFQLDTGMRREETLTLKWEQIDFRRGIIMVEKTKGKTRREIPMTNRVNDIVHFLGDTLFHKLTNDQVSKKFSFVAKKAGLFGFKQHSLRHTFATRLLAIGVDISIVSKLLGHANIDTTMIYAKATTEVLRNAIDALNSFNSMDRKMDNGPILVPRISKQQKLLEY